MFFFSQAEFSTLLRPPQPQLGVGRCTSKRWPSSELFKGTGSPVALDTAGAVTAKLKRRPMTSQDGEMLGSVQWKRSKEMKGIF